MKKLCSIKDIYYPNSSTNPVIRETVRGILLNDKLEVALIHIVGTDDFGPRDHYELPGGGIDEGETHEETFIREMKEELGTKVEMDQYVGTCDIEYHVINRIDIGHFYIGHIKEYGNNDLEDYEKLLFEDVVFVKLKDIEAFYENHKATLVGEMIHRRDLNALKEAKRILNIK